MHLFVVDLDVEWEDEVRRSRDSERGKRLFRCLSCGLKAHKDAIRMANIASLSGEKVGGYGCGPCQTGVLCELRIPRGIA